MKFFEKAAKAFDVDVKYIPSNSAWEFSKGDRKFLISDDGLKRMSGQELVRELVNLAGYED